MLQEMITSKQKTIFLILPLLFLSILLPLVFLTRRSQQPIFSFYPNFFPSTETQFTTFSDAIVSEIKDGASNATIDANHHHKSDKGGTFAGKGEKFVDSGGVDDNVNVSSVTNLPSFDDKTDKDGIFVDEGEKFVDSGGLGDNGNVSSVRNHQIFGDKTEKDGIFVDEGEKVVDNGGLGDNGNVSSARNHSIFDDDKGDTFVEKGEIFVDDGVVSDDCNAANDPKFDDKSNEGGIFVDKGETFVDEGGLSDNSTTEIKDDVSNATIHTNHDPKISKGDTFGDKGENETFVDKNGDGNETSGVPEVVLSTLPGSGAGAIDDEKEKKEAELLRRCNLYEGKWVKDEEGKNYPIYKPGTCPYVDEAYDCQSNGRLDSEYLKWRWKPDECELPRFSSASFLERLRGKKLMLVGDSMNRNQFESLICMLWEGLSNKSKMYEIHGNTISKGRGYFAFKFEDYDCLVVFVRSHFLVKEGVRRNGQGSTSPTLSIDIIDKTAKRWRQADILVFNTGHWWTHGKTARGKNYYSEGGNVYPHFDAVEAYRRAMKTWAKWIDENMSSKKLVIYRGYSSAHFRGGDWDSGGTCKGEKDPAFSGAILDSYPLKMTIVEDVIKDMKIPVVLLNVTKLTNFRKDGHPSVYGKIGKVSSRRQDCSHWCLPGVPDAWNELVFATMLLHQTSSAA